MYSSAAKQELSKIHVLHMLNMPMAPVIFQTLARIRELTREGCNGPVSPRFVRPYI